MPEWIHERAKHILAKNPDMPKRIAFASATQQSHAVGKTPKGYGTAAGKRVAKAKFDKPKKQYVKTPNPGKLKTKKLPGKAKMKWTGTQLVPKKKTAAPMIDEAAAMLSGFAKELEKSAKYLHSQVGKPKLRPQQADAPNPKFRVKQAWGTGWGPTGGVVRFPQASMIPAFHAPPVKTGGPPSEKKKEKEKRAYTLAQLLYAQSLAPGVGALAGSRKGKGGQKVKGITRGALGAGLGSGLGSTLGVLGGGDLRLVLPLMAAGGYGGYKLMTKGLGKKEKEKKLDEKYPPEKEAQVTPAARLTASQQVGTDIKKSGPGPSSAQQSRPVGFGKPLPGVSKEPVTGR
jgi:hypothetical protein